MTYPEIAAYYGLRLEDLGWKDRRVTRSGLRKFLIEVWMRKRVRYFPDWEGLWLANTWASTEGRQVWHRKIPALYFDEDRAKVAWYLRRERERTPQMAKAAKWASRRSVL